jgi:hypothetical protein
MLTENLKELERELHKEEIRLSEIMNQFEIKILKLNTSEEKTEEQ